MRYLTVQNFGTSLGVEGARLVVREHDGTVIEESLSRLRGIRIAKKFQFYSFVLEMTLQIFLRPL